MSTLINPYFIAVLLDPVAGLSDVDEELHKYEEFDANDDLQVRAFMQTVIVPYIAQIDVDSRERVRSALAHYLVNGGIDFTRLLESHLLPFQTPHDARRFFELAWENCFGPQDFRLLSMGNVTIRADIDEPSRTLKIRGN